MSFKSDLVIKEIGDDKWELVEPLIYKSNLFDVEIPIGFTTDLTTWYWEGSWTKSSVLHDYLLSISFDRSYAYLGMDESMKSENVSHVHYHILLTGITIGDIRHKLFKGNK